MPSDLIASPSKSGTRLRDWFSDEERQELYRRGLNSESSRESIESALAEIRKGKTNTVDHPSHYTSHPTGIECIDVVEAFNFNVGNAIKYLWRAGLKEGTDEIEDLQKALWYVQREITRRSEEKRRSDDPRSSRS